MIQGTNICLHKNTFCEYDGADSNNGAISEFSFGTVVAFDAKQHLWVLQPSDGGKRVYVPESAVKLRFSLLPNSISKLGFYHRIAQSEQGACGRGLVAAQDIKAGMPIFQEHPLLVVRESTRLDDTRLEFALEHHSLRWHAYKTLVAQARREASKQPGAWSKALNAFKELGIAEHTPEHVTDAAAKIAASEGADADVQQVRDTLMRYFSNQFGFRNGAVSGATWGLDR